MIRNKRLKKTELLEKKSRAKYKCPVQVDYWLAVMKEFVQPNFELPEWKTYYIDKKIEYLCRTDVLEFKDKSEENEFQFTTAQTFLHTQTGDLLYLLWKVAWRYLEVEPLTGDLPSREDILTNKKSVEEYTEFIIFYYEQVFLTVLIIRHLANHFEEIRKGNISKKTRTGFHIPVMVSITPQNKVSVSASIEFLEAINQADADNLRICKICKRIFWAKREKSETCSRRCRNVRNVRISRSLTDEEKAERKAKREANRELIKNGKAKPTKRKNKNGSL